jgi:hypothetical protein
VTEINAGLYAFDGSWLWSRIGDRDRRRRPGAALPSLVAIADRGRR